MNIKIPENFEVQNEEYMQKVLEFACKLPTQIQQTLIDSFDRLRRIGENTKQKILLFSDWAPYSFYFRIPDIMEGGIIFHGNHDNGGDGSAPTFSFNLSPINGWSVHT